MKAMFQKIVLLLFLMSLSMGAIIGQSYTNVFVNGYQIPQDYVNNLSLLQGSKIQPGYYYLDQQGNFGVIGYKASMNVYTQMKKLKYRNQNSSSSNWGTQSPSTQQSSCKIMHGDYITIDRANRERAALRRQGYDPWIFYAGSLYAGTRTYRVYYYGPCN